MNSLEVFLTGYLEFYLKMTLLRKREEAFRVCSGSYSISCSSSWNSYLEVDKKETIFRVQFSEVGNIWLVHLKR